MTSIDNDTIVHLELFIRAHVPADTQDKFRVFAFERLQNDPEFWMFQGWNKLFSRFLGD